MISTHWTGICKSERSEEYASYLRNEALPALTNINGFISATVFHRRLTDGTEFLVTTLWTSLDALRKYEGIDAEIVKVPEKVSEMMVQYDEFVRHYELL